MDRETVMTTWRESEDVFVQQILDRFPSLTAVARDVRESYGELFPHLFLAALVRHMQLKLSQADQEESAVNIDSIVHFLGENFDNGNLSVRHLIAASFVENMPYPHEPGVSLISILPQNLKLELKNQRG